MGQYSLYCPSLPALALEGGFLEFRGETHLEMVIRRRGHREARLGNGSFQIVSLLSQPCRFASTADSWDFKESKETGLKVKARIPHLEGLYLRFSLGPRRPHTPRESSVGIHLPTLGSATINRE